jgi:serine/threonine protein kinase
MISSDVSHYVKGPEIGSGAFGKVHVGYNSVTDEKIAMKYLEYHPEKQGIPALVLREISILRSVSHPNIIQLQEVITTENQIILIFEYLERTLYQYISTRRTVGPETIRSFSYQLLAAVHTLHVHRIIHRDIKPTNILLSNTGILKVIDFGWARYFSIPMRPYTPEIETILYRAPELLSRNNIYGPPIDIWSVGCVIAEMVMGHPIFLLGIDSNVQLFYKMIETMGTPPNAGKYIGCQDTDIPQYKMRSMREILNSEDAVLCDLVSKMLCFDPDKRITAVNALKHPYFLNLPEVVTMTSTPEGTI